MVAGMVINVITSCSLRPANWARKPPMDWMPSCELPAMRMTASVTFETFGLSLTTSWVAELSLIECVDKIADSYHSVTRRRLPCKGMRETSIIRQPVK